MPAIYVNGKPHNDYIFNIYNLSLDTSISKISVHIEPIAFIQPQTGGFDKNKLIDRMVAGYYSGGYDNTSFYTDTEIQNILNSLPSGTVNIDESNGIQWITIPDGSKSKITVIIDGNEYDIKDDSDDITLQGSSVTNPIIYSKSITGGYDEQSSILVSGNNSTLYNNDWCRLYNTGTYKLNFSTIDSNDPSNRIPLASNDNIVFNKEYAYRNTYNTHTTDNTRNHFEFEVRINYNTNELNYWAVRYALSYTNIVISKALYEKQITKSYELWEQESEPKIVYHYEKSQSNVRH